MHYFELDVVLIKRDPNALVREYRHIENVASLDIATSTANALIARMAAFDGDFRSERHLMGTEGGRVTRLSYVYWSNGAVIGFANITETH